MLVELCPCDGGLTELIGSSRPGDGTSCWLLATSCACRRVRALRLASSLGVNIEWYSGFIR